MIVGGELSVEGFEKKKVQNKEWTQSVKNESSGCVKGDGGTPTRS